LLLVSSFFPPFLSASLFLKSDIISTPFHPLWMA
jgi:hypothetical protein